MYTYTHTETHTHTQTCVCLCDRHYKVYDPPLSVLNRDVRFYTFLCCIIMPLIS